MQEDNTIAIPIDAFMRMCEEEVERLELRRRARDKFKELDTDKSGYLDNEELHKVVNFMYHTLGKAIYTSSPSTKSPSTSDQ